MPSDPLNPVSAPASGRLLDGVDWAARLDVTSFGVHIGVRVDDPALLPKASAHLPPGCTTSRASAADLLYSIRGGERVEVYAGEVRRARTLNERFAFELFESVVRFDVAARATEYTFIHAGAVGWRDRAIVIPGASAFGKSTLVEALVRAGATYYSDEFAVLDEAGRVHPFAQPLKLQGESGKMRRVPPAEIGTIGEAPLAVGWVASTWYEPGKVWEPRPLQPGEALLELFGNTVRARLAPAQTLKTLARAVETSVAWLGPRGDAAEMANDLLARCTSDG